MFSVKKINNKKYFFRRSSSLAYIKIEFCIFHSIQTHDIYSGDSAAFSTAVSHFVELILVNTDAILGKNKFNLT